MTLADRTIGGFPVAIGTSLALETFFKPRLPPYDPQRVLPEQGDISQFQTCWINVATLFRNLVGAISKEQFKTATVRDLTEALEHEIDTVTSVFRDEGNSQCQTHFYYAEYPALLLHHKQNIVEPRTERTSDQVFFNSQYQAVLTRYLKHNPSTPLAAVKDAVTPDRRTTSLILTHAPLDLSHHTAFDRLVLLESHTGKLKPKSLWYTKYHELGKEPMQTLPFYRPLLYLFGDHTSIRPTAPSLRRSILEISRNRQWTPMTQWMTVRMHLELDFADKDFLSRLFKTA